MRKRTACTISSFLLCEEKALHTSRKIKIKTGNSLHSSEESSTTGLCSWRRAFFTDHHHTIIVWCLVAAFVRAKRVPSLTSRTLRRVCALTKVYLCVCMCVCVFVLSSRLFWTSSSLDAPAGVTQKEGHTGFLHLPSAVLSLNFPREKDSSVPFPCRP